MCDVSLRFEELVGRVRAGDEQAAAELVQHYEPVVRRVIRLKMRDRRLRRVVDSMDVCQSVLASFFVRASAGEYDLDSPEQLVKLLAAMAQHKVIDQARKEQAQRRDHHRRTEGVEEMEVAAQDPTPSQQAASRELLAEFDRRLTAEEKRLVELRRRGHDWNEIAAEIGENAVVLRKRLSRAIARVSGELGLQGDGDG